MENDKYFTPDIEDFHIGYECEIYAQCTDKLIKKIEWHSVKVNDSPRMSKYVGILQCKKLIKTKHIRVPYLTNEQIEAEGWKYYQNIADMVVTGGYVEYYKDVEWFKVIISISETTHYLTIEKVFQNVQIENKLQEFRNIMYNGECKDINTFRKITKLLGI